MACLNPLLAVDYGLRLDGKHHVKIVTKSMMSIDEYREKYESSLMFLPCGHCVACAQDYARAWQCRIMCEYESRREKGKEKACFLTLTYNVAPSSSESALVHLRQFIKDLRNKYGNGLKFFACTEKGSLTKRLHHHAIIFGVDFAEDRELLTKRGLNYVYRSKTLESLWTHGFSSVGSLDIASAGYVSKYCDKKKISGLDEGESVIMSRGLGKDYFRDHKKEIFDSDYLYFEGNKFKMPRIFLRWALNDEDFLMKVYAQDYADRKRLIAESFRYDKCKSLSSEEDAILDQRDILVYKKSQEEVLRDVL